jgi:hypothetical protein
MSAARRGIERSGLPIWAMALVGMACGVALSAEEAKKANRWEKAMQAFEQKDAKNPPPRGEVVFIGSSSIVGWNLSKYFPDLKTVNRGFGGSAIADSTEFADRILIPLEPRIVVFFGIKPSLARWKLVEKMRAANQLIADFIKTDERLRYVDADKPMLSEDGKPKPDLLARDGLHLSPAGYELWTRLLLPHLR